MDHPHWAIIGIIGIVIGLFIGNVIGAAATFDPNQPNHPLNQITLSNGTTPADDDGDDMIDNANNSQLAEVAVTAQNATNANTAAIATSVIDNSITTSKLADKAVQSTKIETGAVNSSHILDGSIQAGDMTTGVFGALCNTSSAAITANTTGTRGCAAGYSKLIGGGCSSTGTISLITSAPTTPSSTQWQCTYSSATNFTVYVICCK